MRTFLNSGNDIETVEQMKTAIESGGGIRGVRVKLCSLDYPRKEGPKLRWEGVSFCLLYTSPSPRDLSTSRMPSSA